MDAMKIGMMLYRMSAECDTCWMDAEAPLFMLYTSGSTGKPKGVVHCTGGYMVYAATTTKYVFDISPGDIFWCTACLLYTSDAADELDGVDLGGRLGVCLLYTSPSPRD